MTWAADAQQRKHRVYLIDGSGYIFRAFHALPPMTRPDGTPVNAVYGFTNMLMKLIDDTETEYIAVIFDSARQTFRNDIYPDYKAHRPPPPEELVPQFDIIREAVQAFNVPAIERPGFEADDLIATYARLAAAQGAAVTIVSSDKDLMQLVGPHIRMLDPMRNRLIGPDEVVEKFGVGPDKVVDVQALAGDASDNVPGVPGIGVKTAAELINTYGDLDNLLAHAGEIKQPKRRENLVNHADLARVSRELVKLRDDVPLDRPLEDLIVCRPDPETLLDFLDRQGFKSTVARVAGRMVASGDMAARPEATPAEATYSLVQSADALAGWIAQATRTGIVAFDTETTSLDTMRATLVGVSLAINPGEACYIPLGHVAPSRQGSLDLADGAGAGEIPAQIPLEAAIAALKPMLEDPGVLKIGHNVKYDSEIFARYGVAVAPVDDTMLLSYVLDAGLRGHGLDELARHHLDHTNIKYSEVTGSGKKQIGFAEVALEAALDYAAEDADITLRLHRLLKPRLVAEHMVTVYETLERPLIPVLVAMERCGILVDAAALTALSDEFEKRLAALAGEIHRLAGHAFNIGSPKQLGEVLFDEMGIIGGRKGKTGAYATGADVLDELALKGHELPAKVLEWRQLAKLKSTYTDALIGQINPETGRVHTSYAQAVAATGRLASTDPNLQNIPIRSEEGRKIRRAFIAAPGHVLLSADYSQIELRLLAHVADIAALKEAFRRGADIHAMTAAEVFGVPVEGMDPALRNRAKAINFGIIYGISPFGLARQLAIPQAEARSYIERYFEQYPGIRDYMERTRAFARTHGYVTTIFGRKCHTPGINDKNPARRSFSERAAINAPLQGAAADIIKRAMVRLAPALAEAGLGARMLLQVHDELVLEVPQAEHEKTAAVVRRVMERAARLDVPLVVDTGAAANWADAH
jgi:DNA polymerase I